MLYYILFSLKKNTSSFCQFQIIYKAKIGGTLLYPILFKIIADKVIVIVSMLYSEAQVFSNVIFMHSIPYIHILDFLF